jgi:hypothetical protein
VNIIQRAWAKFLGPRVRRSLEAALVTLIAGVVLDTPRRAVASAVVIFLVVYFVLGE